MSSSDSYRRPESVLVLVYTRHGDVLLMQRVDSPEFWQSITGGMEVGEQPATTASRELIEETGIDVDRLDTRMVDHQCSSLFEINGVWRKRYHPDQTHNREHLFSVRLENQVDITLNDAEHSDFVWLPADQAMGRATSSTNKQAIEDIVLSALYRS